MPLVSCLCYWCAVWDIGALHTLSVSHVHRQYIVDTHMLPRCMVGHRVHDAWVLVGGVGDRAGCSRCWCAMVCVVEHGALGMRRENEKEKRGTPCEPHHAQNVAAVTTEVISAAHNIGR